MPPLWWPPQARGPRAVPSASPPPCFCCFAAARLTVWRCPPCRLRPGTALTGVSASVVAKTAPLVVGVVVPLSLLPGVVLALALVLAFGFALIPFTGRAFGRLVLVVADVLSFASARWPGACGRVEDGLLEGGDVRHDLFW